MNDQNLRQALRESGRAGLNPESATKIRRTLLSAFDDLPDANRSPASNPRRPNQLIPQPMIPLALVAIVLAIGVSTTAAANAARPGDVLYGWDQAAERIRLALTFGDDKKATYQARVAEERVREQFELEDTHSVHVVEATTNAGMALDQAIETVGEVRVKLENKPGRATEALTKVETRLRDLRSRHEAREKKNKATPANDNNGSPGNGPDDKRQNDSTPAGTSQEQPPSSGDNDAEEDTEDTKETTPDPDRESRNDE